MHPLTTLDLARERSERLRQEAQSRRVRTSPRRRADSSGVVARAIAALSPPSEEGAPTAIPRHAGGSLP